MHLVLTVLLSAGLLPTALGQAAVQDQPLPVGEAIPKVECRKEPGQSYAVYLPSRYSPSRTWPILVALDPRARGMIPIELFRGAAEERGFIIVSSNGFMSDSPIEPSWNAVVAMWNDAIERFAIDPKRIYASGFSGGARISWVLADYLEVPVAGIIGVGAGLPWAEIRPGVELEQLAFYGLVGTRDFNHDEMVDLDQLLHAKGLRTRLVEFEDRHNWPPEAEARAALEWMDVEAMVSGLAPVDKDFVASNIARRISRAEELKRQGDFLGAEEELADVLRQSSQTEPSPAAVQALESVRSSKEFARQVKKRDRQRELADESLKKAQTALQPLVDQGLARPQLNNLLRDLDLDRLQRRARVKDREERLAAARVLEWILTQTSFYIARQLREAGDRTGLMLSYQVAVRVDPSQPGPWYGLARVLAVEGKNQEALEALGKAVETGLTRRDLLVDQKDFDSIRDDPRFTEILVKLDRK